MTLVSTIAALQGAEAQAHRRVRPGSGHIRATLVSLGLPASSSHVAAISSIARLPSGSSMISATCLAASACCCQ